MHRQTHSHDAFPGINTGWNPDPAAYHHLTDMAEQQFDRARQEFTGTDGQESSSGKSSSQKKTAGSASSHSSEGHEGYSSSQDRARSTSPQPTSSSGNHESGSTSKQQAKKQKQQQKRGGSRSGSGSGVGSAAANGAAFGDEMHHAVRAARAALVGIAGEYKVDLDTLARAVGEAPVLPQRRQHPDDNRELFVGLSLFESDSAEEIEAVLRAAAEKFGEVERVSMRGEDSTRGRFAFVKFATREQAEKCLADGSTETVRFEWAKSVAKSARSRVLRGTGSSGSSARRFASSSSSGSNVAHAPLSTEPASLNASSLEPHMLPGLA